MLTAGPGPLGKRARTSGTFRHGGGSWSLVAEADAYASHL